MFANINVRVRRLMFMAAAIGVYAFVLPAEVRSIVGSFAVGWCLFDIALAWFPGD